MIRYLPSQLLLLVLGLWAASLLIFFTLRVMPGDVAQVIGGLQATPEQLRAIRESLGLNLSLPAQYLQWIGGLLHGDFGTSLLTGTPVASELAEKFQVTLPLALLSLLFGLVVGVPLGIYAGLRRRGFSGIAVNFAAQLLAAVPAIWGGLLLILVFALRWRVLPSQGFPGDGWAEPARALRSLVLPALTIGIIEGAVLLRFVRSAVLDALNQDYVRTAAAKGLTRTRALLAHGLPNVALSVISVLGLQIAGLIVGAVVVEQLFNLPGVGRMLVSDVGNRDLVKVQGELLALTGLVLVVGTAVDLLHRTLDPRQRAEQA